MTNPTLNRRNTSLMRGLHYFEAVARHQSVKLAAAELGVSQSAVSHQLRELTESLGEQLIFRSGRGIALTPTGQRLSEKLAVTFSGLQSSVEDIVGNGGSGGKVLRLAVCSSFGPGWLIPRLPQFFAAHPDVDLQLRLYSQDPEQTDQVADAFVTALAVRPGFAAVHIIDEMLVAVQAPGKTSSRLITTDIDEGNLGRDWMDYCLHTGMGLGALQTGAWLQCTHYVLALEMAKAGLGVALVPDFLARRPIEEGSLAYFDRTRMSAGRAYHLCFKTSRSHEAEIRKIALWLKDQAAAKPVEKPVVKLLRKGGA